LKGEINKNSIQNIYENKFNKEQQIKRIEITWVIFKIYKKLYRKHINKNNTAQSSIE
jgi:hypothetical protein